MAKGKAIESLIDPAKYVVLDVETDGLSSLNDDLLSVSLYLPDTGRKYNRFLPLELALCQDINTVCSQKRHEYSEAKNMYQALTTGRISYGRGEYNKSETEKYRRKVEILEQSYPWLLTKENPSEPIVRTTEFNGITAEMLTDKAAYTQKEVFQELLTQNELAYVQYGREILHYGGIDEKFIRNYLKRKKLRGYDLMVFHNIKDDIFASRFADGIVTKDNLCNMFGIKGVKDIHEGINDCVLEWQLFEKMQGGKLIVIGNRVYRFTEDYVLPITYVLNYPKLKKYIQPRLPKLTITMTTVFEKSIKVPRRSTFLSNAFGEACEHMINTMLKITTFDNGDFLGENFRKLIYLGKLPLPDNYVPVIQEPDGTVSAVSKRDLQEVAEVNKVNSRLRDELAEMIAYIRKGIFHDCPVFSQELSVDTERQILAKCDLSNEHAVLEIKTLANPKFDEIAQQLFFQARGRKSYLLYIDWSKLSFAEIKLVISEVTFSSGSIKKTRTPRKTRDDEIREFYEKLEAKSNPYVQGVL